MKLQTIPTWPHTAWNIASERGTHAGHWTRFPRPTCRLTTARRFRTEKTRVSTRFSSALTLTDHHTVELSFTLGLRSIGNGVRDLKSRWEREVGMFISPRAEVGLGRRLPRRDGTKFCALLHIHKSVLCSYISSSSSSSSSRWLS